MHTVCKCLLLGAVLVTTQVKAQQDPLQLNDTAIISEAATPVTAPATMKKKWNHLLHSVGFPILLSASKLIMEPENCGRVT